MRQQMEVYCILFVPVSNVTVGQRWDEINTSKKSGHGNNLNGTTGKRCATRFTHHKLKSAAKQHRLACNLFVLTVSFLFAAIFPHHSARARFMVLQFGDVNFGCGPCPLLEEHPGLESRSTLCSNRSQTHHRVLLMHASPR